VGETNAFLYKKDNGYRMIVPGWLPPILIGIDLLVVIYAVRVAVTEKKRWGWPLALGFGLFLVKEVLTYNGVSLPSAASLVLTAAGLVAALCSFYFLTKELPS
jgi:hypothetical protein